MDEYVMKQKIQRAFFEPRAPEGLIQQVTLRARAVAMGAAALKVLEAAPAEDIAGLTSRAVIGQLAAVTELPNGVHPEQLARQLARQPAFLSALRGGNIAQRLSSGELLEQIIGQKPEAVQTDPEKNSPKKEGPVIG